MKIENGTEFDIYLKGEKIGSGRIIKDKIEYTNVTDKLKRALKTMTAPIRFKITKLGD